MTQASLFGRAHGPTDGSTNSRIDLRCCSAAEMLASLDYDSVDLVVTDAPWPQYKQRPGKSVHADITYPLLDIDGIAQDFLSASKVLRPGGKFVAWTCWPLLVEALMAERMPGWLAVPDIVWKTGGAWTKDGPPGGGFYWRGHSEPVLVGVKSGAPGGRARKVIRSALHTASTEPDGDGRGMGHVSVREGHSRKPALWMAEWVRAWVPPGGTVVDPYAGSGSVAEAVVMAGGNRHYVGSEIDESRHAEAMRRIASRQA